MSWLGAKQWREKTWARLKVIWLGLTTGVPTSEICDDIEKLTNNICLAGKKSFGLAKKVVWNFHWTIKGNNDTTVGYITKDILAWEALKSV